MPSRMDRYKEETEQYHNSRSNKNQELYQKDGIGKRYTDITSVMDSNAIDLNYARRNVSTREGYQQMREYGNVMPIPKAQKELEEFNYLYQDHDNRIYDINSVLEEARKNRIEKDALEEKRKLKNTNYNILASLNPEELEQYRKEKKERAKGPKEEELRELIDTITSKTLAGELDKATSVNLLSDLMATNMLEKQKIKPTEPEEDTEEMARLDDTDSLSLSKEIIDHEQIEQMKKVKEKEKEKSSILEGADQDFYTRSMDLTDKDFDMADEFKEKKLPVVVKIILVLLVFAVIAVAAWFVWKTYFK